jgi:hypothetical protein
MNTRLLRISFLLFILASVAGLRDVVAQGFTITTTLHENGTGTLQNSNGFNAPLVGVPAPDPGPGGLSNALTFGLLNPPGLVGGDFIMTDPGLSPVSDIIRFNSLAGTAIFYSLVGGGQLADTGLPTALNTNTFSMPENTLGLTSYTPTAGQPGFVSGAGGPVTYLIDSDSPAVPDLGSSALLLALALAALLGGQSVLARRKQTA